MKSDFRFDKIFLEPFIATNEEDENDYMICWYLEDEELPEEFHEEEEEEEFENFFFEKNLTNVGKV